MFMMPEDEKPSAHVDIKGILNRYIYHWPLFAVGLFLALTAAFFYLKAAKPLYEVKAAVLIKDEKKTPDQQSALHEIDLLSSSKTTENEIEVLKSQRLVSQVVKDLQLWINYSEPGRLSSKDLYKSGPVKLTVIKPSGNFDHGNLTVTVKDQKSFMLKMPSGGQKEFLFNTSYKNSFGTWKLEPTDKLQQYTGSKINIFISDPEQVGQDYQKSIDASVSNKLATAIILTFDDPVAQRGKDFLNQLIYNYNLAATIEKNKETKSTIDFIDQRLADLSVDLISSEKNAAAFKSSRGLTDITTNSKISLDNLQMNDNRLNDVNVQLSVIENIERYVNSPRNSGKAPSTVGVNDAALGAQIERLTQLQAERDRLLATTPETNPDFEPLNRQIATTREAIKESVANIKSSLLSTRSKLQSYSSHFESSIKDIPTQERQFGSIKRQQESKESLYTYLLQKKEELSVSYASTLSNDRVIDQAYLSSTKGMNKPMAMAMAVLMGLALPAGLIYARNTVSSKITNTQQISQVLNIPVLSELPFESSSNPITINDHDINATTEQFRALRTKLYHLYENNDRGRVTLITSSVPGEGKSFISSNLAASLAYIDRKTVILELDMRKPQIAGIFNLPKEHPGISNYINGTAGLDDIIQSNKLVPNLDVIACGSIVKNPSELLENKRLKELITTLSHIYDDLIIDSPPVHLVPDAMILSRMADLTLYVIRQGYTELKELNFIKELHQKKLLPAINIIFNGIERVKYGYGYDYTEPYYNAKKSNPAKAVFSNFWSRF